MEETDESTTTRREEIAPVILSPAVGLEVSAVTSQSFMHAQRGKLG
jgi:hypothetical protein